MEDGITRVTILIVQRVFGEKYKYKIVVNGEYCSASFAKSYNKQYPSDYDGVIATNQRMKTFIIYRIVTVTHYKDAMILDHSEGHTQLYKWASSRIAMGTHELSGGWHA